MRPWSTYEGLVTPAGLVSLIGVGGHGHWAYHWVDCPDTWMVSVLVADEPGRWAGLEWRRPNEDGVFNVIERAPTREE